MHEIDGLGRHLEKIEELLGGTEPIDPSRPHSNDTDGLGQHLEYIEELLEGGGGGTSVEANVELSGNENTLESLKVGETTYAIKTYQKFPTAWVTDGTTKAFYTSVNSDPAAVEGMAFLGELTCSDLPAGMVNAEAVVEINKSAMGGSKVVHLVVTSGNSAPYR